MEAQVLCNHGAGNVVVLAAVLQEGLLGQCAPAVALHRARLRAVRQNTRVKPLHPLSLAGDARTHLEEIAVERPDKLHAALRRDEFDNLGKDGLPPRAQAQALPMEMERKVAAIQYRTGKQEEQKGHERAVKGSGLLLTCQRKRISALPELPRLYACREEAEKKEA